MKRHWLTRGVYNRLYRAPILAQEFIQTMILLLKKKKGITYITLTLTLTHQLIVEESPV